MTIDTKTIAAALLEFEKFGRFSTETHNALAEHVTPSPAKDDDKTSSSTTGGKLR
jgi:hypothetical protein